MKGIDVSYYQGIIDWTAVRRSGVQFAMIKASQSNFTDPQFQNNIQNASAAGIACGVYHYLDATSRAGAIAEANYYIQTIAPYRDKIQLWAALDVENVEHQQLGKNALTEIAIAFCDTLKAAGFKPMIYANRNFLVNCYDYERLKHYPLWYACWYNAEGENDNPQHGFDYQIWQHGIVYVDGINGQVDGNFGYFELPDSTLLEEGDIIAIRSGAKYYGMDVEIPDFVREKEWIIDSINGDRVVINRATDGTTGINSAIYAADCIIIDNKDDQMDEPIVDQPTVPPVVEVPPTVPEQPTADPAPSNDDPPQSTGDPTPADPEPEPEPEPEPTQDEKDESTLVDFFKMILRACLIAVRSIFGKGGNK